jgi:hypothetical protein
MKITASGLMIQLTYREVDQLCDAISQATQDKEPSDRALTLLKDFGQQLAAEASLDDLIIPGHKPIWGVPA